MSGLLCWIQLQHLKRPRYAFWVLPAGVNEDDEFVPQAGVAYSQLDLPK